MPGFLSWFRERLSPEATPSARRKRSNAWLGNGGGNDGGEREDDAPLALAVTGTSRSSIVGAASGNAEAGRTALTGSAIMRPSKTPRQGSRQGLGAAGAGGGDDAQLGLGRSVTVDGAATRPPPPRQTGIGDSDAAVSSTPARLGLSLSPLAAPAPAPAAQYGSGVSVSATPGVGGLRAVAGGMMSVTPRTPVRRWTHEEGSAANVGVGTRIITRGEGTGMRVGAGRGGAVGAAVVPPGYTYGMAILPQTTPRRLIMATAYSSRVRPTTTTTATATTDTSGRRTGRAGGRQGFGSGYGYGYGSGYGAGYGDGARGTAFGGSGSALRRGVITTTTTTTGSSGIGAFGNRSFGSSSSSRINSQRTSGIGFERSGSGGVRVEMFESAAERATKHAAYLEQYGRRRGKKPKSKTKTTTSLRRRGAEARVTAARVASAGADDHHAGRSREIMATRGLNNLRSKARKTLEKQALEIQTRNPEGAELLRKDARHIENWGREAAEGARREAEENARRLSQALAQKEAEQAAAKKKADAEAAAAAAAQAQALARKKEAEAEFARVRAREEEAARLKAQEQEEARLAEAAAAAAAAAAQEQERLELSPEQEEQVAEVWFSAVDGLDDHEVAVQAYNDIVSKGSMRTLRHGVWLGDEVINLYMKSIQARNREAVASGQQVPKCGIMSSFFYTQLSDNGRGYRYQGVKRFLKKAKIDLFDLDKFMFPVNVNRNHWTLAVINFRLRRLEYYDSMGQEFDNPGFEYMARFVDDESKSKRGGKGMDISDWPRFNYANLPYQTNSIDCGVFASMFADRLSKGRPLSFSQSDIGLFRQVMTLAILRGERVPTEEEAFLEDGGTVPSDAPAWWDPPQDEEDDEDYVEDVDDDDDDGEAEDDSGRESGEREEEAGPRSHGEGEAGGRGQFDPRFEGAREGEREEGFDLSVEGAHEEQAHVVDLNPGLSSKSNSNGNDRTWPTFPGEQSNGGGTPAWASATIE